MLLLCAGQHGHTGSVQIGKPGIILLGSVHRFGSQSHDDSQHSRAGVHVRHPLVGAVAVADSGGAGHEVFPVVRARYPLYQNCHLFILFIQSPHPAVFQCGNVHGAGIHLPDSLLKGLQTLLRTALIDAENRFIFPAKAFPKPSSKKLEERTIKGFCPKYSSTSTNRSRILAGNTPWSR